MWVICADLLERGREPARCLGRVRGIKGEVAVEQIAQQRGMGHPVGTVPPLR